jgi:hypothetical protein
MKSGYRLLPVGEKNLLSACIGSSGFILSNEVKIWGNKIEFYREEFNTTSNPRAAEKLTGIVGLFLVECQVTAVDARQPFDQALC